MAAINVSSFNIPTSEVCCGEKEQYTAVNYIRNAIHEQFLKDNGLQSLKEIYQLLDIGRTDLVTKKIDVLTELFLLSDFVVSVFSRMLENDKCWHEYVSEIKVQTILNHFTCIGLDVSCYFRIPGIYYAECNKPVIYQTNENV